MKRIYIVLLFFLMIFSSCSLAYEQKEKGLTARVSVETDKTKKSEIKVYVETLDGQISTGASVVIVDESNQVTHVPFNTQEWCHSTEIVLPDSDFFRICISSVLLENIKEIVIPYSVLEQIPTVIGIQDSDGVSAFLGGNPNNSKDIQVEWISCGDDVVYYVTVKDSLGTVYSVSTEQTHIIIPASTLKSEQNYYVTVQAQKINGDPLFQNVCYYSLATCQSSQVGFLVE